MTKHAEKEEIFGWKSYSWGELKHTTEAYYL